MVCSPLSSYVALGFVFGLVILLTGIGELLRVGRDSGSGNRQWHLMLGIADIIIGIILMGHITASVLILRIIVGLWFLFRGLALFSFSGLIGKSWILTLGGIITTLFGILILFNAAFGAATIILFTAIAFISIGIFNTWLAFRLKRI